MGVLCSRGSYEGGRVEAPDREIRRGVEVTRVPSPGRGRKRHSGRLLEYADKKNIPAVAIIGPEEKAKGTVTLKWLQTGEQTEVAFDAVAQELR